jgi:hypothetical protein
MLSETYDVVFGSSFIGTIDPLTFKNRIGNNGLSFVARLLLEFPSTDMEKGEKAFRKSILSGDRRSS